jgi:hypothetical protein
MISFDQPLGQSYSHRQVCCSFFHFHRTEEDRVLCFGMVHRSVRITAGTCRAEWCSTLGKAAVAGAGAGGHASAALEVSGLLATWDGEAGGGFEVSQVITVRKRARESGVCERGGAAGVVPGHITRSELQTLSYKLPPLRRCR